MGTIPPPLFVDVFLKAAASEADEWGLVGARASLSARGRFRDDLR